MKLDNLAKNRLGKSILDLDVLDWGVGCGRILRHFLEHGSRSIIGCDIDLVNVQWVKNNLTPDVYHTHLDPPLPFNDNSFDVIFGHSIFTHLSYEDQFKWLEELNRILRPNGVAVVTICGETGVYITKYNQLLSNSSLLDEYHQRGFIDFGALSVGVDSERPGYYRLIGHTHDFIYSNWLKYMDIDIILPCFAQHQDAVVLTKK